MNILKNFNKEEQYTINNILKNNLFEIDKKKFYQFRKNWLYNKVLMNNHLKFISLLVMFYDLAQNNFEGIYDEDKSSLRKEKIITLMKAYLHNDKYIEPKLVSSILDYMFELDYFDKELLELLNNKDKNKELDKYYQLDYLQSFFEKLRYIPSKTNLNIPYLGIQNEKNISNNLSEAILETK